MNQRRYEALRAYFTESLTYEQAGARFGYTRWAMINLVRDYRAGKLELFAPPRRPGPPPTTLSHKRQPFSRPFPAPITTGEDRRTLVKPGTATRLDRGEPCVSAG